MVKFVIFLFLALFTFSSEGGNKNPNYQELSELNLCKYNCTYQLENK